MIPTPAPAIFRRKSRKQLKSGAHKSIYQIDGNLTRNLKIFVAEAPVTWESRNLKIYKIIFSTFLEEIALLELISENLRTNEGLKDRARR
jgi:hypothetical protein